MLPNNQNIGADNLTLETLQARIIELEQSELSLLKRFELLAPKSDHLQALMDTIPDSIYFKNMNNQFVLVNKAWATKRNLNEPEEAVGKTDFDYFNPEFAQHTYNAEQEIMRTGSSHVGQLEKLEVNGNSKWYTSTKVPVKNPDGKIIGTCGITRDITELKQIEEKLEEVNQQLEDRVKQRTIELNLANSRLQQQIEQLDFLYKSSITLSQSMVNIDIHSSILLAFKPCFPGMEGCICTRDEYERFIIRHSTGTFKDHHLNEYTNTMLESILGDNLTEPILIPDWKKHPLTANVAWPVDSMHSCCIIVPILNEQNVVSCLIVFAQRDFINQYEQEKSVLMTLSTISAVCIKNSLYYDELQKSARIEGELNAARNIQKKLIPQSRFSLPYIDIHGYYLPAHEVGGDYLDYFENDAGNIIIAIGDVCGKGAPASMHMTMLRTTLRIKARHEHSAMHLVCEVNDAIRSDLNTLSFISLLCIIVNKDSNTLTYARAGHPFLIQSKGSEKNVSAIECSGIALGLLGDSTSIEPYLSEVSIPLGKGDQFFIYTDGLIEAVNRSGQGYGMTRLLKLFENNTFENSEQIIRTVLQDADQFTERTPYRDDLTICAFTIK